MGLLWNRRRRVGALAIIGLGVTLSGGTGCQNKVADERDALYMQNRELQAKLDQANAMRSQDAPVTPPEPVKPAPEPKPSTPTAVTPAAPPPVAPVPTDLGGEVTVDADAGTTTVNFLGDALFDSGKAVVKQSAKPNLDKVAAALKGTYAGKTVKVQGHSDSDPIKVSNWKSNQELSEARAKAVRDYIVSKGVPANQVSYEGFGDTKPKSPTDKAKNRRVEVVVMTR